MCSMKTKDATFLPYLITSCPIWKLLITQYNVKLIFHLNFIEVFANEEIFHFVELFML